MAQISTNFSVNETGKGDTDPHCVIGAMVIGVEETDSIAHCQQENINSMLKSAIFRYFGLFSGKKFDNEILISLLHFRAEGLQKHILKISQKRF